MAIRTRAYVTRHQTPAKPLPAKVVLAAPAARAAQTPYEAGIARIRATMAEEAKLPLQKGSESRLYVHPEGAPKGTIVMYHGFTAGTWQFDLLAQQAYADGYNVYIPRLPGHGLKDAQGVEDPSGLLKPNHWKDYETFAERTYQEARGLGGPVSVMGLSVGGNLALSVAENHPDVKKVVLFAPFLRPKSGGPLFDTFHFLDKLTFGQAGRLLDLIPFHWDEQTKLDTASGKRPGHSQFYLGNIYAASEFGRKLIADSKKLQTPIQFFTTDADDAAAMKAIQQVHDRPAGKNDGWYEYPLSEGIPHPMVHPMEDKGHGQTPELYRNTLKYLDTGLPVDRGPAN